MKVQFTSHVDRILQRGNIPTVDYQPNEDHLVTIHEWLPSEEDPDTPETLRATHCFQIKLQEALDILDSRGVQYPPIQEGRE
ncbi:hypothetical protein BH739_16390 [Enterococcus casseliflavus]|nr:hypothetical protein BH739_16390 [Enterococcus casseliflavus]